MANFSAKKKGKELKIEKKGNKKQKRRKLRGRGPFTREIEKKGK